MIEQTVPKMRLWLLEAREIPDEEEIQPWALSSRMFTTIRCDVMCQIIVRAESEQAARETASNYGSEEVSKTELPSGLTVWLDPKYTTCAELTSEGLPGHILAYSKENPQCY
jgi:xanthine dehydrogenase molybdopterin-binding subunit B